MDITTLGKYAMIAAAGLLAGFLLGQFTIPDCEQQLAGDATMSYIGDDIGEELD